MGFFLAYVCNHIRTWGLKNVMMFVSSAGTLPYSYMTIKLVDQLFLCVESNRSERIPLRFMLAPPPLTSKLWSETSKLKNETLNWNFETPRWNFKNFFKSSLRPSFQNLVYFSNLVLLLGLQSKSQSLLNKSFKEDPKNFVKFQIGVSKFQF